MGIEGVETDVLNGGFVSGIPPHEVGLAETPDGSNFDPAETWGVKLRAGSSKFGVDGPTTGCGITIWSYVFPWTRLNATTYYMTRIAQAWYSVDTGSWLLLGSAPSNGPWTGAFLNDHFVAGRGPTGRAFISTTGTSVATLADVNSPSGSAFIEAYANKIWIIPTLTGNTIYWSATDDPADYTTVGDAGNAIIGDGVGLGLVGSKATKSGLYIFKGQSTWLLTGTTPADFEVQQVANIGLVSNTSVLGLASDGEGVFFVSLDGIYYIIGTRLSCMSDAISETWGNLSVSAKANASIEVKGDKLFLFYDDAGGPTKSIVLAFRQKMEDGGVRGVWSPYPSQPFVMAKMSNAAPQIYAITTASTPQIYQIDTGSAGSVEWTWSTPDLDFGFPMANKNVSRFYLHFRPDGASRTATVQFYADGISAGSTYVFNIPSTGSHVILQSPGHTLESIRGKYLRMKVFHTGQVTFHGYQVYAEVHESEDLPRN